MNKIGKLLPIGLAALSLNSLHAQKPLVEEQKLNNPPTIRAIPSILLSRNSIFLYNLLNEVKKTKNPEHIRTIMQQVIKNTSTTEANKFILLLDVNFRTLSEQRLTDLRRIITESDNYLPIAHDALVVYSKGKLQKCYYTESAQNFYGKKLLESPELVLKDYQKRYDSFNCSLIPTGNEEIPYVLVSIYQLKDSKNFYASILPVYRDLERINNQPVFYEIKLPENFMVENLNEFKFFFGLADNNFIVAMFGKYKSYVIINNNVFEINTEVGRQVYADDNYSMKISIDKNKDIFITLENKLNVHILFFIIDNSGNYIHIPEGISSNLFKYIDTKVL